MEYWRQAYLGMRSIPYTLNEFELATFFTFSAKERMLINARRRHLYRLALAIHIGFVRMTGRTLDACRYVPRNLWQHLGQQLGIEPPDLGTMTSLYDGHTDTLIEHQVCAYQALGFGPMTEHQRRYLMRWLKSTLSGRQDRNGLLHELKRWLYEHRILLPRDRTLRELIVQAVRDVEATLTVELTQAFGETTLERWGKLLPKPHGEASSLQQWLWSVPLRNSTRQMSELFRKIDHLVELGVRATWPDTCNEAIVRHYARRCANRKPQTFGESPYPVRHTTARGGLLHALRVVLGNRPAPVDAR